MPGVKVCGVFCRKENGQQAPWIPQAPHPSAANKGESIANLPVNNGVWWERRFYLVPGPPVTSSGLTWTTKSKGWAAVHQPGLQRQELGHRQLGLTRHNTLVISGTASSPPAQAPQHALTSLNSWHCQVSGRSWYNTALQDTTCHYHRHTLLFSPMDLGPQPPWSRVVLGCSTSRGHLDMEGDTGNASAKGEDTDNKARFNNCPKPIKWALSPP